MAQTISYSASEEKMLESEQEGEIDGVDPWKAAMQVRRRQLPTGARRLDVSILDPSVSSVQQQTRTVVS